MNGRMFIDRKTMHTYQFHANIDGQTGYYKLNGKALVPFTIELDKDYLVMLIDDKPTWWITKIQFKKGLVIEMEDHAGKVEVSLKATEIATRG